MAICYVGQRTDVFAHRLYVLFEPSVPRHQIIYRPHMSFFPLLMLPLLALGGLVVILFIGKRRRNSRGEYVLPAPASPQLSIFEKSKHNKY